MKRILLSLGIMGLAVASCKKDNKDESCPITQESIAGSYKLTSFKVAGFEVIDDQLQPCEKDDVITLNANGTYAYQDAGTVCDPNGSDTGEWQLVGNKFSIDYYPDYDFTIEDFDCKNLVGTSTYGGASVQATFVRQ